MRKFNKMNYYSIFYCTGGHQNLRSTRSKTIFPHFSLCQHCRFLELNSESATRSICFFVEVESKQAVVVGYERGGPEGQRMPYLHLIGATRCSRSQMGSREREIREQVATRACLAGDPKGLWGRARKRSVKNSSSMLVCYASSICSPPIRYQMQDQFPLSS